MLRNRRAATTFASLLALGVLLVPALVAPPAAVAESVRSRAQRAAAAARAQAAAAAKEASARAATAKQKAEKALVTARSVYRILTVGPPTTTTLVPPVPVTPQPGPVPQYGVAKLTTAFVDRSRPTEATKTAAASATRTLKTLVLYPANAPAGTSFPLVVFGHGLGATPNRYATLLSYVASMGYVVAAPTFPVSSRAGSGVSQLVDGLGAEGNQPGDLTFVIDQLLALGAGAGPLRGLVDPSRIGAAGHSLGAVTALSLGYNECCFDPRVGAVVAVSGVPNVTRSGRFFTLPPVPLLLVHGDADDVVPYVGSALAFAAAGSPKYLLTVVGGDHGFGLAGRPGTQALVGAAVGQAVVDFFDRYLKDRPVGIDRLRSLPVAQPGLLRLEVG